MENKIKCSIIIPIYNQEKLIMRCLENIPKRKDIEIICVNDGSTDNTKDVLDMYKKVFYNDLIIIDYKKNKGVSYARNKGIEASKGEYLLFIDSDDFIYGTIFNRIVNTFLTKTYDLIFYDLESNKNVRYPANRDNYKRKYGMYKFIKKAFLGDLRFSVGIQYAEDKELHLKLIEKNPRCVFSKEIMYHYNYPRKGSLSAIGENR